ncbi:hypothetical protein ACFXKY_07920 [Streptomyces canus]|uniref:hypothetical protein n=1 Tax=Streptomyces canus TaxID=58343 RepID=UPI0036902889
MTETTDHEAAIAKARADYDRARTKLFTAIRAALEDGVGPSAIARPSKFTREYVAKIRDGKGPKE